MAWWFSQVLYHNGFVKAYNIVFVYFNTVMKGEQKLGDRVMKKYGIESLIIEVTRRCNMNCAHCLRGDAQSADLNIEVVNELLKHIESVTFLTITGGEPTLNINGILDILESFKSHHVDVYNLCIITNGKENVDELLSALDKWHSYISGKSIYSEREISGHQIVSLLGSLENVEDACVSVALSVDQFHDPIPEQNVIKLAMSPYFSKCKVHTREDLDWVIKEGRGEDICSRSSRIVDTGYSLYDECFSEIYLSCDGDITGDCDMSYETQEVSKLGNILDEPEILDRLAREYKEV